MQRRVSDELGGVLLACALTALANTSLAQAATPAAQAPSAPLPASPSAPGPTPAATTPSAPTASQPPTTPAAPLPTPIAAAPAQPPTAAAPPSEPADRPPAGEAACLLGEHDGISEANARTSTAMVCGALREAGAQVRTTPLTPAQAYGFTAAYRVALRPLGNLVLLHVSYEAPVGQELSSRRLQLSDIEEMTVAAPRVADALVHDKPLSQTANIANLVGEDTRRARKATGESFFALGIFGFTIPDDAWAGYGVLARFHYQTLDYAVGLEGRMGASGESEGDAHLYGLSVGARYYFSDADWSPFIGGGLGVLWVGVREERELEPQLDGYAYDEGDIAREGSGMALSGEVGIELLRMHESRLDVGLRADVPWFEIGRPGDQSYVAAISLFASYSFN